MLLIILNDGNDDVLAVTDHNRLMEEEKVHMSDTGHMCVYVCVSKNRLRLLTPPTSLTVCLPVTDC